MVMNQYHMVMNQWNSWWMTNYLTKRVIWLCRLGRNPNKDDAEDQVDDPMNGKEKKRVEWI